MPGFLGVWDARDRVSRADAADAAKGADGVVEVLPHFGEANSGLLERGGRV